MSDVPQFQVRDRRRKGYFLVDDLYLNGYAKQLGPIGTAIYLSLCRHADRNERSFPSEQKIGEEHGLTDRTVRKYLRLLERLRLIAVERRRAESGGFLNNVYFLLDKTEWVPPAELNSAASGTGVPVPAEPGFRYHRKLRAKPAETGSKTSGTGVPHKGTQLRETQIREQTADDFVLTSPGTEKQRTTKPLKADLRGVAERVFRYYLKALGKSPIQYKFLADRRELLETRAAELHDTLINNGGGGEAGLQEVEQLMCYAVDRFAESDWHMGRDPKTNGESYRDLEYVFGKLKTEGKEKGYGVMEKWIGKNVKPLR